MKRPVASYPAPPLPVTAEYHRPPDACLPATPELSIDATYGNGQRIEFTGHVTPDEALKLIQGLRGLSGVSAIPEILERLKSVESKIDLLLAEAGQAASLQATVGTVEEQPSS